MCGCIADNPGAFGAVIGRLDIEHVSIGALGAVGAPVVDDADGVIRNIFSGVGRTVAQLVQAVEDDPDAEVDIDFPHRIAEVFEGEIRVAAGIDHHNEAAAPPHHFVKPEIFEVAAIGQIDVAAFIGGLAECLIE